VGKVILILTAACLLATLVIISNSSFKTATSASPKVEEVKKKAEKDRPMKREQDSRAKTAKQGTAKRSQPYSVNKSKEGSVGVGVMPEEDNNQDAAHAIIKGEYAPVYSVNSRDSSVVKLLKRGDRVATDLEVTDAQGKWTIVKKGDLTRPGFVLDENLQRASTTKK
jgi:ATP-dependent 26S proteasome regulatory subunit